MREKAQILDEFWLKVLGLLLMTADHVGLFMMESGAFPEGTGGYWLAFVLRCFGRLAFPLFAFMLAEGLHKTHDRENYLLRLALMWMLILLAQTAIYLIFQKDTGPDAFTDLLLLGLFIYLLEHPKRCLQPLALLPLAYIILSYAADVSETYAAANGLTSVWTASFPLFLRSAYSLYGFLIFLGFYYAYPLADRLLAMASSSGADMGEYKKEKPYRGLVNAISLAALIIPNLVFWAIHYFDPAIDPYSMGVQSYAILAGVLLMLYNGKRGYDAKWFRYFEYAYYPAHIVLLALAFGII